MGKTVMAIDWPVLSKDRAELFMGLIVDRLIALGHKISGRDRDGLNRQYTIEYRDKPIGVLTSGTLEPRRVLTERDIDAYVAVTWAQEFNKPMMECWDTSVTRALDWQYQEVLDRCVDAVDAVAKNIADIMDNAPVAQDLVDKIRRELNECNDRAVTWERRCEAMERDRDRYAWLANVASNKALLERAEAAEQEHIEDEGVIRVWRRRCEKAESTLNAVEQWTHEFGAHLCPPGADTYGEGVRDCKQQVADILSKVAK